MKKTVFIFVFLLLSLFVQSQGQYINKSLNMDMERVSPNKDLPDGWFVWGQGYHLSKDDNISYEGKYSIVISSTDKPDANFGCAAYSIPAKYTGREIELKAYIKMDDVRDGHIGLLLRVDGVSGTLGFDNMSDKGIKGTSDWAQYSVKFPYPEGAKNIYIGAMLQGKGKIWADNFEIFIDGKNIKFIEPVEPILSKADKDDEFDKGSGIALIDSDAETTSYLKKLGLIWGYVKYYHPAVAKGEYNWDAELFRYLPKILAASNNKERDKIIYDWLESLGEFEAASDTLVPSENVKLFPDLDWIDNSGFDVELVSLLQKIKTGKREHKGYYISAVPFVGNPVFTNERPYKDMKYPDAGLQLLSLYRYWNMIQYFFPYKHLIEGDWKDVLSEFIPKFLNAADELEYKLATLEIIGRIHDTHANIWGYHKELEKFRGEKAVPYMIKFIENKAVVMNYFDAEKAAASGLQIGDVITRINGKDVEALIKERQKYYPASNFPTQLRDIARNLLRTNDASIQIEYIRDKNTENKTILTYGLKEVNIYKAFAPDTCFKMINKDIAYIYPGKIKNSYLPEIMKTAANTKGVIVDFRSYPSDFIVFTLGSRLVDKPSEFVKFTIGQINNPGYFVMSKPLAIHPDILNHYKEKVVVLINETTQSSAEYTTMAFRAGPRTTVIGSTTAGADGNVSAIVLPGSINSLISGIGIYYPDGRETQRIGIVPDIELKPTIKGIKEGRDELLEKAIEIINK